MPTQEERDFEAAQYSLRAGFYYRARTTWSGLIDLCNATVEPDWADSSSLGISDPARERVTNHGVGLRKVFANPDLLRADTRLIAFYRNLALLSQKGLQRLVFGTKSLEAGKSRLSEERAMMLCEALNSLISLHIEADPDWTLDGHYAAASLNVGSQINGSWRNAIGEEGGRQIRSLIVGLLLTAETIEYVELMDGTRLIDVDVDSVGIVRIIKVSNGCKIVFSPEPDVAIFNRDDVLIGTMEVKYGSDPAGALERYGATKKSFESAVAQNAQVQNVYVANAITGEVRRRIAEDRLVSAAFEFRKLSVDQEEREDFTRFLMRRILDI